MATRFELVLVGEDEPRLRAAGEEALFELEDCERSLSLFRRDSLLNHIHRAGVAEWVALDTDTFRLFEVCDDVYHLSGGAFDPTVAPLLEAHGLRDGVRDLAAAKLSVGWQGVVLDPERQAVRLRRPDIKIDLGAIGKGHGLDLAARALRDAGVGCAFLQGGTSTAVALGAPPGASGWRVRIGRQAEAPVVTLRDRCLSVSQTGGRTVRRAGKEIGHVIDPRTGQPARGTSYASAIAPSAALADAWSTALLVAGSALPPRDDVRTFTLAS